MEVKIKLVHNTGNLNIFSICIDGKVKDAFEHFLFQYANHASYNKEVDEIIQNLKNIGKHGATDQYFLQENGMKGRVFRLHDVNKKSSFRIPCLIFNPKCILIGGHALNDQHNKSLIIENTRVLHELDAQITKEMASGRLKIVDNLFQGPLKFRLP